MPRVYESAGQPARALALALLQRYRQSDDGVRAFAILLVLGSHSANVPRDGWLGVDLFLRPLRVPDHVAPARTAPRTDPDSHGHCAANQRALRRKPVVYLGVVSYSVYVWHLPVFLALGIHQVDGPRWLDLAGTALTVLLASITFHLVEQPLRRYGRERSRRSGQRREGIQIEPLETLPTAREVA